MARRRGSRRRNRSDSNTTGALLALAVIIMLVVYLTEHAGYVLVIVGVLMVAAIGISIWLHLRRRARWLARVQTLNDLLGLTPTQFELAVGELLQTWGYQKVHHTGGGGDLAADLTCWTPDGQYVVVQCKRYSPSNTVGSPEIQKFIGMLSVHHRAQQGIFVTTSAFTQPALALARQHSLRTIDGHELGDHVQRLQALRQQGIKVGVRQAG